MRRLATLTLVAGLVGVLTPAPSAAATGAPATATSVVAGPTAIGLTSAVPGPVVRRVKVPAAPCAGCW